MNKTKLTQRLRERIGKPKNKGSLITQLFRGSTEADGCGENPTTKTSSASSASVTIRLAELSLADFIKCYCYEDYTPVQGDKNAWLRILSEYYIAKQDGYASKYLGLIVTMRRLEHRAEWVSFMATSLLTLYTDELAAILREEYPRFKFTYESHRQDLQGVANMEKGKKIEFDAAKKEFEQLEKQSSGSTTVQTAQSKEHAIHKSVIGINAALQASYNVGTLNALTYALLLHEVDELIQKQKNNNG